MALFAISDLHLDLNGNKPMDIFGDNWYKHEEKIKKNWIEKVKDEDTVLIAGDISWSMSIEGGLKDLDFINELPGRKIMIKGNHDYWWTSISKLNKLYDGMNFIQNNFYEYEDYAICGTRGWTCPGGDKYTQHDEKIYTREQMRLKLSLDESVKAGFKKHIVMLHYPPTNVKFEDSGFTEIIKKYEVEIVIYGHLHGSSLQCVLQGDRENTKYIMTSCDFIDFNPITIL